MGQVCMGVPVYAERYTASNMFLFKNKILTKQREIWIIYKKSKI